MPLAISFIVAAVSVWLGPDPDIIHRLCNRVLRVIGVAVVFTLLSYFWLAGDLGLIMLLATIDHHDFHVQHSEKCSVAKCDQKKIVSKMMTRYLELSIAAMPADVEEKDRKSVV